MMVRKEPSHSSRAGPGASGSERSLPEQIGQDVIEDDRPWQGCLRMLERAVPPSGYCQAQGTNTGHLGHLNPIKS